jgi:hypothetical protein
VTVSSLVESTAQRVIVSYTSSIPEQDTGVIDQPTSTSVNDLDQNSTDKLLSNPSGVHYLETNLVQVTLHLLAKQAAGGQFRF